MDRFWSQSSVNQLDINFSEQKCAMVDEAFVRHILFEEFALHLERQAVCNQRGGDRIPIV